MTGPELQKEVAEAGGIPFKADVPLDFMSRRRPRALPEGGAGRGVPRGQGPRPTSARSTAFGLLAPGTDLRALRAQVLEENIAGFYDERPGHQRLYAVSADRRLSPANQLILAHELRHALQDQYVALQGRCPDDVSDFDDRRLAWVSLLEGDATLVMERFLVRRLPRRRGRAASARRVRCPLRTCPARLPWCATSSCCRTSSASTSRARSWTRGGWPARRSRPGSGRRNRSSRSCTRRSIRRAEAPRLGRAASWTAAGAAWSPRACSASC